MDAASIAVAHAYHVSEFITVDAPNISQFPLNAVFTGPIGLDRFVVLRGWLGRLERVTPFLY